MMLIPFVLYLLVIAAFAVNGYLKTGSLKDFLLAGRRLSGPVAGMSAGAADMSAWLMMAVPGSILVFGFNHLWLPVGLTIGAYLNWRYIAPRLRVYTEFAEDAQTVPSYFDFRFHDDKHVLRIIGAIIVLVFFTGYSAAGFVATAKLFHLLFDVSYMNSLLLGVVIIFSYTCIGGLVAIAAIDFFQAFLMFIALLIIPAVVLYHLGGYTIASTTIAAHAPEYFNVFSEISTLKIISLMMWGVGYFGQLHIALRFMAISNIRAIPTALWVNLIWMVLCMLGAVMIGFCGRAYFIDQTLEHPDTIFIIFSKLFFHPVLTGVLLAAFFSAIISSVASQLLTSSSAISSDCYRKIKKNATDRELTWVGRSGVVLVTFVAAVIALNPNSSVLELVAYAWAGLGASFGPVIVCSLYWKAMTRRGAIAGMVAGALGVIGWVILAKHLGGWLVDVYEMIPGFFLSCAAVYVFSKRDPEHAKVLLPQFLEFEEKLEAEYLRMEEEKLFFRKKADLLEN